MIVLDASAAVATFLRAGPARDLVAEQQVHVPHLIDAEVAHSLPRLVLGGRPTVGAGTAAVRTWGLLGLTRHDVHALLPRIWELWEERQRPRRHVRRARGGAALPSRHR